MGRFIKSELIIANIEENSHIMNLDGIAKEVYMVILQKGDAISKAKLVVE
jgi:pyruvate kinase